MVDAFKQKDKILALAFLLAVFLTALSKVQDTDAWMHLSMGRELVAHQGFPRFEPYQFTMEQKAFTYSTWLFGLLTYLSYAVAGIHGLVLLKAVVVTLAFSIMFRDALRPFGNRVLAILALSLVVLMTMHRFVERPDILLMVYLAFSIFSLNAFLHERKKYFYALPVMHLLWANSHSSIVLMFVPFVAVFAGSFLQKRLRPVPGAAEGADDLYTVAVVFMASLGASLISPYFLKQFYFGAGILANPWYKLNIAELNPPMWEHDKWPFFMTALVAGSFLLNRRRASVVDLLYVLPFVALAFSAKRFIFVLGVVSGPVLARNIASWCATRGNAFTLSRAASVLTGVWIVFLAAGSVAGKPALVAEGRQFGLGIDFTKVPEGALRYMDRENISGRVFNDFAWGGYIAWRDYPKRRVFVDPRGYLPAELLSSLVEVRYRNDVLDALFREYGFQSVLVSYPSLAPGYAEPVPGTDFALADPGWSLVYWDDLSLLYLKRGGAYDRLIEKDGYRYLLPGNGFQEIERHLGDDAYLKGALSELERNIRQTGSSRAYVIKGYICNRQRNFQAAIDSYTRALEQPGLHLLDALYGLAYAYQQLGEIEHSTACYKRSLGLRRDASVLAEIAINYTVRGDGRNAVSYFKRALNVTADPALIQSLQDRGYADAGKGSGGADPRPSMKGSGTTSFKRTFMKGYSSTCAKTTSLQSSPSIRQFASIRGALRHRAISGSFISIWIRRTDPWPIKPGRSSWTRITLMPISASGGFIKNWAKPPLPGNFSLDT